MQAIYSPILNGFYMPFELQNINSCRALVVGDVMLDEYWVGETNRISPEAPVPVVLVNQTKYSAGGAANVAINLAKLSCNTDLLGVTGQDQSGQKLNDLLNSQGNLNNLIISNTNFPTINKLRIISNNQQLFRIDREQHYCQNCFAQLLDKFKQACQQNKYNIVILSDYNKRTLQDPQALIKIANQYNIPVIVDPKNPDVMVYKNATLLTPNLKEFKHILGLPNDVLSQQQLTEQGHNLITQLNLDALVITQGQDGLTLLTKDGQNQHLKAHRREVFDVSGAGDTVIATLAAGIVSKQSLPNTCYLATINAGIAVSKPGVASVSWAELKQELTNIEVLKNQQQLNLGIIQPDLLSQIVQQQKSLGENIVLVNGCFDILHAGHIQYLAKARQFGDRLIVAVNDDESIRKLKGDRRPINNLQQRMEVLASLRMVDWVVPFGNGEIRPGKIIQQLNPNVLIKSKEAFNSIAEIPDYEGGPHVLNNGGTVHLLGRPLDPDCDISSSKIIANAANSVTTPNKHEVN
jgi:D-beta-D-heptose 7-phosphate kinase/D-beta-D-heptose 1-phosphate adenosyltransferase